MIKNCDIILNHNIFKKNIATYRGGSLFFEHVEANITFYNNAFIENSAKEYGDIYLKVKNSKVKFSESNFDNSYNKGSSLIIFNLVNSNVTFLHCHFKYDLTLSKD